MHTDELSKNAMGGTELMGHALYKHVDPELLNQFQIIRSRVRELDPTKKKILWLHDLANDPEARHLSIPKERQKFDKLVFVSHWQQQQYNTILGVPYSAGVVIENAIVPLERADRVNDGTVRLIYHSTPHRGLELLVPTFELLAEKYPITLDVYSSFDLYGWPERNAMYQKLFDRCKAHEKINYHGTVSNDEIRKALQSAHMFAFPSIWPETSCLCLMEAMSAGVACIHPNYAALPETAGGMTWSYPWTENTQDHVQMFAGILEAGIQNMLTHLERPTPNIVSTVANYRFSWEARKQQWETLLKSMLTK